ncbi:cobyric acid synthase [Dyadobacter sp. LHD-138]|uniref:cobyric acid synthase n=1 Tax=Dyadobacter sp. LHD-138 TaxID=3071413 RepID=UPI0027DF6F0F|nr:cobyric acid synthase [Dyadobacter sp. LHD-138]MDQ6480269.1 cobyric acid synthase [Dyadobacter sp. LHD-138]
MSKPRVLTKPIMFVGTASDVGKSVICAGFCRIFKQDGYYPAPFKAQNMSLNSYVTPEGLELGRAQAVQAEAAGIPCHTDMNPVLLKPTNDQSSQVILNGKPVGNQSAFEYFKTNDRKELFQAVTQAYDRLSARYAPIVMEGAGSISELNLKKRDITNLRMALHADAATYLIGDIDRGGIFGSVYGTIALLTPEERQCIKGIIVNKFRGDARLFEDGKKMLEELTGVPVVGVLPFFKDIHIEEEDSVSLQNKFNTTTEGKINVAVILLKRLSNFTDFDRLEKDPRVHLFYTNQPEEIAKADIIIIPGSKNTLDDLLTIKNNGAAKAIITAHKTGKRVVGICGGYQMMGESIADPDQVEGSLESMPGLGLLPVKTILKPVKTTVQQVFSFRGQPEMCTGYEIHMGETTSYLNASVAMLANGKPDGYYLNENCWGTYLHGILDNETVVEALLAGFLTETKRQVFDYAQFKELQYDRLAAHIRTHVDMEMIYSSLE